MKDYKIPGIRPKYYAPIFLFIVVLWIAINPAWYWAGYDLFFFFGVLIFAAISAVSTFIGRRKKHR